MSRMDFCQECGAPGERHELISTDVGTIHRGACHQRFTLAQENVDMTTRLWAALSLYDMQQPPLVKVRIPKAGNKTPVSVLGVIVDHLTVSGVWLIEDNQGKLHEFATADTLAVEKDAYAA